MTDLNGVTAWIDGYVRAWNSNDPAEIGALFTPDAEYFTAPFRPPWRGREQIVEGWLDRQDEPGETTFEWQPVTVTGEVAVIQGVTRYPDQTFSNLWVIRLDAGGRCDEFTEWWMEHTEPDD
ncbi:MAG: hypothetical protein AUI14_15185 [Actinobacteria bacterium 13_2_20CM_2_71_6]|nr:MAG: hypothetical protein AUI14_15185 [Actinobacteria bacterium 13_2_20CM_2_71_6]